MIERATVPADVDRLFAEAISRGDLDAALAQYAPDAVYHSGDTYARGTDEIRAALQALIERKMTLVCHEIDCHETAETAVLRARWTVTAPEADGRTTTYHGRSIEVVQRNPDGTWQFIIDLPNGDA